MNRRSKSGVRRRDTVSSERLCLRLDTHTKRLIERAARLKRQTVTEYCVSALAETARSIVERHETLVLSAKDRDVFFDVLMTRPPASERLRRAFAAARRRTHQQA